MGIDVRYTQIAKDRSHVLEFLPKSQEELPKRSMQDSFAAAVIPLSTDVILQDKYVSFLGSVRVGRLLENMDMFAIIAAYKHISLPNLKNDEDFPYYFVTAMVERIDFSDLIPKPDEDIKISGHVSWVGKSSMEIVVWLEQRVLDKWNRITRAIFVFTARDSHTSMKPAIVNPIEPANERETKILSGGEDRQKKRIAQKKSHVSQVIPDKDEQQMIYDLYLRTMDAGDKSLHKSVLPADCMWMTAASIANVIFSHPEERNIYKTLFGGFIMRQAEDLSWVLSHMYSKQLPVIKSISDIHFRRPIKISSLVQMHSYVVYTQENFIQITTYVEALNPTTGITDTANTLHFTYQVPDRVSQIIPHTYQEAMMYVDGKRHFYKAMKKTKITEAQEK